MTLLTDDALTAIRNMKTIDELQEVQTAVKARWKAIQRRAAMAFEVGEQVSFQSRRGGRIFGRVKRVNIKSVGIVLPDGTEYRVSSTMLRREV